MDEQNLLHIHNEILCTCKESETVFAEKWMELEIIMLREISQTQKNEYYHVFSHVQNLHLQG